MHAVLQDDSISGCGSLHSQPQWTMWHMYCMQSEWICMSDSVACSNVVCGQSNISLDYHIISLSRQLWENTQTMTEQMLFTETELTIKYQW